MVSLIGDTVSVVLKGQFNPPIFSPSWLYAQGVVGQLDYDDSAIEFITPELARFRCGWLNVFVTRDTLQFGTNRVEEFERLRDAAAAIIRALPHSPVGALGVNREASFEVGGEEAWHRVGDALVPKDRLEGVLKLPGMKSVTVWSVRPDPHAGRIHVTVEPSSTVAFGIYLSHNDHYDLQDVHTQPASRAEFFSQEAIKITPTTEKSITAVALLGSEWEASMSRAVAVMELVADLAVER